jgi:excinuclease UvrABC nuclease subunit
MNPEEHIDHYSSLLTDPGGAVPLAGGSFPEVPGVYCVYDGDELIYVGETNNLRRRMRNLLGVRNHTLGRKLKGAVEHLRVAASPVACGRKEIEEAIIREQRPPYNC